MIKNIIFIGLMMVLTAGFGLNAASVDFTLDDLQGNKHSLSDFSDAKAAAVVFISTRCPVSNAYNERMEALNKKFKDKGIVFLGINSNSTETVDDAIAHAKENGLTFTILKDPGNKVADQLKASFTPEVYVFDGKRELMYHGRIDDSRRGDDITSPDLQNALDAIIAGKPVAVTETKAFGCTIKRVSQ